MTEDKCYILRSLGYLSFPEMFKKKFGINSKKKDRLKLLPEPIRVEMDVGDNSTTIAYVWSNKELDEYTNKVKQ